MAVSMLVAVGDVADPLIEAIKARIPNIKVGDGMDASNEMGPLITREHRDKVASYLDGRRRRGASSTGATAARTTASSSRRR